MRRAFVLASIRALDPRRTSQSRRDIIEREQSPFTLRTHRPFVRSTNCDARLTHTESEKTCVIHRARRTEIKNGIHTDDARVRRARGGVLRPGAEYRTGGSTIVRTATAMTRKTAAKATRAREVKWIWITKRLTDEWVLIDAH